MGIGLELAAGTQRLVAKISVLGNGNGDAAVGIITHVVLCAWFLWCLRFRLKAAVMLFAIPPWQF